MKAIAPGVWKMTFGQPEQFTPVSVKNSNVAKRAAQEPFEASECPFDIALATFRSTESGCVLELPLKAAERIYGFGLQLKSFNQTGKKKTMRTNADPVADSGDSHAPVPFYVSTAGYGVFIDTARYVSFYCGNAKKLKNENRKMLIEIPAAKGINVYFFDGSDMKDAVQKYNLFSGGGCMPPMWGLGVLYRMYSKANMDDIVNTAEIFRKDGIPCDTIGLEPGWQSHYYSCSYVWDNERFPQSEEMIKTLKKMRYHINLWEHVFVHASSPLYERLKPHSGEYEVWNGLVPDLSIKEASDIFSEYHKKTLAEIGIDSFKLDECDGSDYTGGWSFPNSSEFPSGMDGEQMHSLLGILYQKTMLSATAACGKRTIGQVRSSHALASMYPFVLYSDLYDHKDFIRGLVNSSFSGLLWTPEVRQCNSLKDLIRRLQTVVLSPQACINSWMIPNPPWKQYDYEKNLKGELLDNWEEVQEMCRNILRLRMSFIPYLYSCFANYYMKGLPPFKPLVMDYPEDINTYDLDDQYMIGEGIMVAPMTAESDCRKVYFPEGDWYCFWTNKKYTGERSYNFEVELDKVPIFIKDGTILPLAEPVEYVTEETCFDITVNCYGKGDMEFILFEDDGVSFEYKNGVYNQVKLLLCTDGGHKIIRSGNFTEARYNIKKWQIIS